MNGVLLDAKPGLQLYETSVKIGKKGKVRKRFVAKCTVSGCVYNLGGSGKVAKKKFSKLDQKSLSSPVGKTKIVSDRKTRAQVVTIKTVKPKKRRKSFSLKVTSIFKKTKKSKGKRKK